MASNGALTIAGKKKLVRRRELVAALRPVSERLAALRRHRSAAEIGASFLRSLSDGGTGCLDEHELHRFRRRIAFSAWCSSRAEHTDAVVRRIHAEAESEATRLTEGLMVVRELDNQRSNIAERLQQRARTAAFIRELEDE